MARSAWSEPHARSRCCAGVGTSTRQDVRDLAADVLRHRIVLSYDALSDGVTVDQLLERILAAVPAPDSGHLIRAAAS